MGQYTVGFGKISFATAGFSLSAFAVSPPYIRKLVSKAHPVVKGSAFSEYPASPYKQNGSMYSQLVDIPEGTIIQLQATRTYRGARVADGVIFLRTRDTAALRQCMAKIPPGENSLLGNRFLSFGGRFDILDLKELNAVGIAPHSGVVKGYMNPEEIDELFAIVEVSPELSIRPEIVVVQQDNGETVGVFVTPPPRRRIRIR